MLNIGVSTLPAIGKSVCRLWPFIQPQSANPNGAGLADGGGGDDDAGGATGAGAAGIVASTGAAAGGGGDGTGAATATGGGAPASACAPARPLQRLAEPAINPTMNTRQVLEFTLSSI